MLLIREIEAEAAGGRRKLGVQTGQNGKRHREFAEEEIDRQKAKGVKIISVPEEPMELELP